jgi:hypothetical protein
MAARMVKKTIVSESSHRFPRSHLHTLANSNEGLFAAIHQVHSPGDDRVNFADRHPGELQCLKVRSSTP